MISQEEFDKLEGWFWWEEALSMQKAIESVEHLNGVIVECGSFKGKSTSVIASCTNNDIYAVDPFSWNDNQLEKFKEQTAQYNNIIAIKEDAVKYRENFNKPIKLLFIDCDHTYQLTRAIYDAYLPLMVKGGIILFHDCEPLSLQFDKNSDTNKPVVGHEGTGAWIGPTICLQESRSEHRIWIDGARSLHGIKIED